MAVTPINNDQPYLALTDLIMLLGTYPAHQDNTHGDGSYNEGMMRLFAGNYAWGGTALAQGQVTAISENPTLFSIIGVTYGGNNSTTFVLPNTKGDLSIGVGQGSGLEAFAPGAHAGADASTLTQSNLPPSSGGTSQGVDNHQPSLALQYLVRDDGTADSGTAPGGIVRFAGNFVPRGFLAADGQELLVAEHPGLFAAYQYMYGGNGSTTFRVPDLRGRVVVGADADHPVGSTFGGEDTTLTQANLPASMGGSGTPVSNDQPSIALTYIIAMQGIFPGQNSSGGDGTQPSLAEIQIWGGAAADIPHGWHIADGQILAISQETELFAIFGTTYGGDGQQTFALPDLRGRVPLGQDSSHALGSVGGAETHTITMADIPDLVIVGDGDGNTYYGGNSADQFTGNGGDDHLDGNGGTDTAIFTGPWVQYTVTKSGGVYTVTDHVANRDGTDTVTDIEQLKFGGAASIAADAAINLAPVGVDDTSAGDAVVERGDGTAAGNVLGNDTDANSDLGDTKTVTGVRTGTELAGGTLGALVAIKGVYGTLTLGTDGSYSYVLDNTDADTKALAAGQVVTDIFTYGVADAGGLTDLAQLSIAVTGADDPPVISSNGGGASAAIDVVENTTAVTIVAAADPDDSAVSYAIAGGVDAGKFAIDAATGVLQFADAPDHEAPDDAGKNNVYDVVVRASDGTHFADQQLAVTVTNIAGNTITGTFRGEWINFRHPIDGIGATGEEDVIDGRGGDDTIGGGRGNDTFRGGHGHDKFNFRSDLGPGNVDTVVDFKHDVDQLRLGAGIFAAIGDTLGEGEFYAKHGAHKAHDRNDRIIYDTKTGKLYYDDDGNKAGGHAAVHFATLEHTPTLDAGDFWIV